MAAERTAKTSYRTQAKVVQKEKKKEEDDVERCTNPGI
jgi:hypothetical protein